MVRSCCVRKPESKRRISGRSIAEAIGLNLGKWRLDEGMEKT